MDSEGFVAVQAGFVRLGGSAARATASYAHYRASRGSRVQIPPGAPNVKYKSTFRVRFCVEKDDANGKPLYRLTKEGEVVDRLE